MGCCLSTTTTNKSPKTNSVVFPPNHHPHPSPESDHNGGAPPHPPPPVEEETVKEVLSETPIPIPIPIPIPKPPPISIVPTNEKSNQQQAIVEVEEVKIQPTAVIKPPDEVIVSEISEPSEMCSFTESLSTAADKRENDDDDDGEVTQRVHRSPAKKLPRRRPISAGDLAGRNVRSPARRSEPEPSPVKRTSTTARRNVGPPKVVRRDPGEGSGRISRSPATRGGEAGPRRPLRSTVTATERSGGRTAVARGNGGEAENRNEGGVLLAETETTEESLDNPLVSLECFIFL